MRRFAEKYLRDWVRRENKSPLLIRGARQVGKTYLVEQIGQECFDQVMVVNFELISKAVDCFNSLEPTHIIQNLQLLTGTALELNKLNKTLLFLDEIQLCPQAILALRYFKEKMPQLAVIAAGSLLEFALNDESFRMPVGRVEFLYLYPLSFKEFLWALGEVPLAEWIETVNLSLDSKNTIPESIHAKALSLIREYCIVGGMPEVVAHYSTNRMDMMGFQNQQTKLLQGYRFDFAKYAKTKIQHQHLNLVFDQLSHVITQQITYSKIVPDLTAKDIKQALFLLKLAGLCHFVEGTSGAGIPLSALVNPKKQKLLYLDVGLYLRDLRIDPEISLQKEIALINSGSLSEQFVGQELITQELPFETPQLYFWARDKQGSEAEVDYLCQVHDQVIPIEVKTGASKWLKSLQLFKQTYQSPFGIRVSSQPLGLLEGSEWKEDQLLSIPFYLTSEIKRLALGLV